MRLLYIIILLLFPMKTYCPFTYHLFDYLKIDECINNIELNIFLDELGKQETGDTLIHDVWHIVNNINCAGRWQLSSIARKDIGYKGTLKQFLNSPKIQRECVVKLLKKNKYYFQYYCKNYKKYLGKKIHGITITYSGLLAASHLGGVGSVKKFLLTAYNATDGNQSVKDYLIKFQNFNLENSI